MPIRALARKEWELNTNMGEREIILFADELMQEIGENLDSLDLGDALGALVSIAESDEYAGNLEFGNSLWIHRNGNDYLILSFSWNSFEWEGIDPEKGVIRD